MATCWELKASFNVQIALHVILVWNIPPDADATQLLAVWADQVKDDEQQHNKKTFRVVVTQERMTKTIDGS